jgi:hypothetical protein
LQQFWNGSPAGRGVIYGLQPDLPGPAPVPYTK